MLGDQTKSIFRRKSADLSTFVELNYLLRTVKIPREGDNVIAADDGYELSEHAIV